MQDYQWDLHYQFDRSYWWAIARQELVISWLKKYLGDLKGKKILDLGSGSGLLLESLLQEKAKAVGIDSSVKAVAFSRSRGLPVRRAEITKVPFNEESFAAVLVIDVLEHLPDEAGAIAEAKRVLKDKGFLLVMVPACPTLWSSRDERLGHLRRYCRKVLEKAISTQGLRVVRSSYFIFFFFLPWLTRTVLVREIRTDLLLVPAWLNSILLALMRFENYLLHYFNFPFGVSLIAVARKEK